MGRLCACPHGSAGPFPTVSAVAQEPRIRVPQGAAGRGGTGGHRRRRPPHRQRRGLPRRGGRRPEPLPGLRRAQRGGSHCGRVRPHGRPAPAPGTTGHPGPARSRTDPRALGARRRPLAHQSRRDDGSAGRPGPGVGTADGRVPESLDGAGGCRRGLRPHPRAGAAGSGAVEAKGDPGLGADRPAALHGQRASPRRPTAPTARSASTRSRRWWGPTVASAAGRTTRCCSGRPT